MIQLTKGTNVLDINLSDFSGAGQDVVQNGSFNDIGSDLVQNGDFAEIGSELVTNGDFSAVPLSSELLPEGASPMTGSWGSNGTIIDGKLKKTASGIAYRSIGETNGKLYKVIVDVASLDGATNFWLAGTNSANLVVGINTISIFAGSTSGYGAGINNGYSSGEGSVINSISVKEQINLVTNPNFRDTGSELAVALTSWTSYELGTSTVTYDGSIAELNIDALNSNVGIYQENIFSVGKSYKIVLSMKATASFDAEILEANNASTETHIGTASLTTSYQDFTYYFTATGTFDLFIHRLFSASGASQTISIQSVSVKELGEDWDNMDDAATYGENGLTISTSSGSGSYKDRQSSISLYSGKSYKVTYTIYANNLTGDNVLQYYNGIYYDSFTEQGVGTHTEYFTRIGDDSNLWWYFKVLDSETEPTDFVTISSIVVQELGEGWNFNTPPWGVVSNGIASDGANSNDMNQSTWFPVLGKSYKIVYTIASITQGSYKITLGGQTTTARSAAATYTEYITATDLSNGGGRLRIQIDNDSAIGTISSISVKEVGQDWTVQEGWTVEDNKVTSDGTGIFKSISQSCLVNPLNKSYKITYEVSDYVSGAVRFILGGYELGQVTSSNGIVTEYLKPTNVSTNNFIYLETTGSGFEGSITNIIVQQLDTNDRWVTFADPDSKSVMKLGQVDLEIDSSGNNCGVYQTGLIKPNKLYIITINMKATAAIYVEIAASLGTAVSAVIGTELLTTSYKEYSFEYVTPFAVDHDLQIHRLFGSGANQTISIDYVSMNGVDESQWTNDPTWDPFATSLVFVPTLTDESTNNSKQFTLDTSITDGGWDGRSLHGQVIINEFPIEVPASGIINLKQPDFLEGFYQVEIRGYLGTFYRVLGKCMAHLERTSTEDGYNRFESYNDTVTYKAYEE